MRFPDLTKPVEAPAVADEVREPYAVMPVSPIRNRRPLSAQTFRPYEPTMPVPAFNRQWMPRAEPLQSDRRKQCRRLFDKPVLLDQRSYFDRRSHNQRETDLTTSVDVQA